MPTVKGGKVVQSFTQEDLPALQACQGRITFQPLGRNLLRCNQVPRITGISSKQAETFRSQAFSLLHPGNGWHNPKKDPKRVKASEAMVNKPPKRLTARRRNWWGDYECPHCYCINEGGKPGEQDCRKCHKPVLVI